jgi:HAD superfamily hydrolase (TIGR01509 family)
MAVCSNSIRNTIEVMMQKASLEQYLDFYISNQDVKNGKPDPEMYNKAIVQMGLNPKECMIVEDNENGIKAARSSGANVMIVDSVEDVNYENIKKHIALFEGEMK